MICKKNGSSVPFNLNFNFVLIIKTVARLIAWLIQWCLKRYLDVQVKVGQIGLFRFSNVQAVIKRGLNVEIGQVWLSSCFVNPEIRKPLVLRIQEVRIQANIENVETGRERDSPQPDDRSAASAEQRETIPKWLHYAQFIGIRVENLTMMLLKTMLPDSLIHIEGQDISIDSTVTDDSLNLAIHLSGVMCKALKSHEGIPDEDSTSQQCLAEIGVSLFTEIGVNVLDPKQLQVVRFLVSKPQMMMTEGFLQSLQLINFGESSSNQGPETSEESKPLNLSRFKSLKEISFDCSDLNMKILRETKQRSLSIGLSLFHLGFHNESRNTLDLSCNIVLDDFQTSSSQARFAGVTKVEHKIQVILDHITTISVVRGGFFHYHHDEIQYWMTVLNNILDNQTSNTSYRRLSATRRPPATLKSSMIEWLSSKKINYEMKLSELSTTISSASCSGLHGGVSLFKTSGTIKPTFGHEVGSSYLASHDVIFETEVNCVYCWHIDSGVAVTILGKKKHHWNHLLYLEMMMIKVKKLNRNLKIEGMKDNLQLEWSTTTLNTLLQLLNSIFKLKQQLPLNIPPTDESSNHVDLPSPEKSSNTDVMSCISQELLTIKFELTNVNFFLLNDFKVCLMLRTDSISTDYQQCKSSVSLTGLKLVYLHQQEPYQSLSRSVDLQKPVASMKEIRLVYKHTEMELTVQLMKEVLVVWTTHAHMCFDQGLQDLKILLNRLKGFAHKDVSEVKVSNKAPRKLQLNILIHADINLTAKLSKQHQVTLHTNSLLLTGKLPSCLMEINHLTVSFDTNEIFKLKNLVFETLSPSILQRERQAVGNLQLPTNRTWGISIENFSIIFPYDYDFAACFEEVVNTFKWLKLVHKIQRKPFTVDSKLPPDLRILVKLFCVQLSDDPFEVKLGDNFELLKDEYYESINRKDVLDGKIAELQRQHGRIPASRVEDLYTSLSRKSADIYVQRSKQYYNTASIRTKLFTWTMEEVDITALADLSFHGKDNVVKHMKEIDSDSPYPAEGLEFSTLWCRSVSFSVKLWTVRLRDYPLPMLNVQNMHVWGRFIGAEQEATKRAKRTCVVEVNKPWGDMKVERSLPPLKFFHDFSCDMKSWTMAYGVCWEAAFAQYNICLDMVNKPSIDPSQPLPFWDKIRLLFHGRWTMSIGKMNWLYHAQLDPFNKNELMEWTWTNVVLDWTNGKFLLKGDLDISAKTESKYDDCKMFHLPNLRFCVRLEWLCPGNPNDHHSVMPCAPDKVPDYSMEAHDSFRAFRSEKLNLDISLETQKSKENPENIPSCYFYASTLRFMEKIKNCLLSTTRPIRRGKYFNTTSKRKLQLSRHYKKIKMSVNYHQFLIRYWMSFAKQHGFEVLSDSFTLNMCNKLTLVPIEDGMIHRPASDWNVHHLICNLGKTKTWLCQAMPQDGEDNVLNMSIRVPADKSFFLSVNSVSYKRGEKSKKNETKEAEGDQITPTHSVHVNEMRGSWTKKNRTVLIGIYDSYQKAQSLRRNLSSEALKGFKVEGKDQGNKATSMSSLVSGPPGSPVVATSPLSKLQAGHALSMLMKLVSESDSKSVAFTEEPSSSNMEQLHGVRACQTDDVIQKNWLIELDNSQIILKGCETPGYVIVSAAKAQILSCRHHPVWRNTQLRSKTTWVGSVECMQYYATVDPGDDFEDDDIPWLSKENVEDRFEPDLSGVPEMVGSGHSVGGVISNTVGPSDKKSAGTIQLQRIISRCKCQFFYANYGDVKPNQLPEVPLPRTEDSDVMEMEEGIDAFTILHHDLNMCSNPLQYTIILDIVNNLLLYVEPKEKEAKENLQSMRFRLELSRVEDQKTPILQLQEKVRSKALELRKHEKELHKLQKEISDDSASDFQLLDFGKDLQEQLNSCKSDVYKLNEELSIRISCYKESQLQVKQQMKMEKAQQVDVVRRNEVCFKFAKWRLTEEDGQLGITDITLRNFVYTKVNRDDDTWTHLLEIGWVKMANLLPNSIYKDVLIPRDPIEKENRQMTIRILCSERPPVGGIAVKEHFEVNVVPMQLQLTYHFYKAVMAFFFPDKNIETDDQEDEMEGQKRKIDKKKDSLKEKERKERESAMKKSPSFTSTDKIDIMKMRAASNNSFLYIKIPELSVKVSYKGMKEKNIEDVHDFSFVLPTMEHHNRIWTWFDVLMAAKNHSKRTLLSQAIKQKLHMKARTEEPPLTDVQQEEDKAKMLLGAKLLAGQDKPVKKSLFSKSPKQ
ncbi:hypothetical protein LOTGIDRAFT_228425 [Lottia gigantea]|uniref:FMP27/BLTP2/Hobbit GFWDK motif-containing RBG unit domain-containing protein n=1 Tax=Lottia gigantea TaxID=225164 RepID=V4ALB9_LOTGI|nr:hypothetical protein LOTGIDRAFT_228425 [Lottia gigantea]ESO97897.1 hypothetical protein LOTGIDRAFT_228425 [Lottia gigantea]